MQCRSHAAQLGRLSNELKEQNYQILLILGDSPARASQYAESLHLPFPVLADPERRVYHQYGLDKALFVIQRTASILIDCNGLIRYIKTTTNPMVWLKESNEVLEFIKSSTDNC
jgi:peroxiredoxin